MSLIAAHDIDVICSFGRVDYLWSLLKTKLPLVQRFGNPIQPQEVAFLTARRSSGLRLISITDAQRKAFPASPLWRTVFNGVDLRRFPFVERLRTPPYLAFLGRLTANKGVHLAIEVARATGMELRIAGNISEEPGGREYFDRKVRPELGQGIEWIGEIDDQAKRSFLGDAAALIFPIQWEEPFGIVVAESLACGTPVIASRRGSTPELIEDGVTGFLCDDTAAMIRAVARLGELERRDCRLACEQRLSADRMVEGYLAVFREVAAERDSTRS